MRTSAVAILGCVLLLPGCGGGGGGDDGPVPISVDCPTAINWRACATDDGVLSREYVQVGDGDWGGAPISYRALYRFDISDVPLGIEIQSARLRIRIVGSTGSPFGDLGNLWVQHVDLGPGLEPHDYIAPLMTPALDHVAGAPSDDNLRFDVTPAVQTNLDLGWRICDFRLEFTAPDDGDTVSDLLRLADTPNGATAVVVVEYLP